MINTIVADSLVTQGAMESSSAMVLNCMLTHYGLVTMYGGKDLDQHWLR